jgi:rRNA maturation endonuclease Nob1
MAKLKELCGNLRDAQEQYGICPGCGRIYKRSSGQTVCMHCGPKYLEKVQERDMGREVSS